MAIILVGVFAYSEVFMLRKACFILSFVFFALILTVAWSEKPLYELENNIVRLHILAKSDSETDQKIKLEVRDAVTKAVREKNAVPGAANLEQIANGVLSKSHVDYGAKVSVSKGYITQRSYENFTLPYARYTAVRIELGDARGKNWWCVLSPPLCFTNSALGRSDDISEYLSDETVEIIQSDKLSIKFKALETASKLVQYLFDK